jgi:cell wall assembly regulator SMI1
MAKTRKKPASKRPAAKKKPAAKKRAAKKPAAKKRAAKKPAAKKRAAKKPAAKKPAAKKPAAKKPAAQAPKPVLVRAPTDPALIERVAASWRRLESWAAANSGRSLDLLPGASEITIAAAEEKMGLVFPPGFRASLLQHDGESSFSSGASKSFPWMPGCPPLAPLDRMHFFWKELQGLAAEYPQDGYDNDDRTRAGVYRSGRIPIAGTPYWDGDTVYLDLDPGPAGTPGQLICTVTECDFVVLADSFEVALERWVNALESGAWVWNREKNAAHPAGEAPHRDHPANQFANR